MITGYSDTEKRSKSWPRRAWIGLGFAFVLSLGCWFWRLPLPDDLSRPAAGTLTLLDYRGRVIAELASREARVQEPVPLDQMGRWLPAVTVALEDRRFYEHGAVDFRATAAAVLHDVESGRIAAGGSTITQQLVKIATGRTGKSWRAKIRESLLAWKLERAWSKERILAEYLNRADYGNRRLGPEAASRACFGKSARDLTLAEAVFLAGLPQSPSRLNPWRFPAEAARKYENSLARLERLRIVTPEQRAALAASPPEIQHIEPVNLAPHFTDAIRARWPGLAGRVRTTLDLDLQRTAELMVRERIHSLNRFDVTDAALVVIENSTGAVRAMAGSPDYRENQTNGALTPRSCGSTLKPFLYLAAIDRHILTAATLLPDTPDAISEAYRDYDPRDYDNRFLGPVRVREALGNSLNVPAVVALSRLGARRAFDGLETWGFHFPQGLDECGAGFILGNAEIRLLDLAGAYAGLARKGSATAPALLASTHNPVAFAASPEAAEIITDILCDNDAREKTFGPKSPLAFPVRVAAKTGTSSGFRDGWAVGFNKDHTVAVWTGNADGRPMRELPSIGSAAPLWAAMMRYLLLTDRPVDPPRVSDKLARVAICKLTGLLPSSQSGETISELFLKGTEPAGDSSSWFIEAGGKTRLLLPAEYAAWCHSPFNWLDAVPASNAKLAINNPKPNATYQVDDTLPRSQQMVEFVSNAEAGVPVDWFVNGQKLSPGRDGRVFWRLSSGHWQVKAASMSQEAVSTFDVEE